MADQAGGIAFGAAHATLSASGAAKWMNCPGSVELEKKFPRTTSTYADEGTIAHGFAERCLTDKCDAEDLLGKDDCTELVAEMARYVQEYVDYVRAIPGDLVIEQRVDFSKWVPEGFGTADAVIMTDKTMHVVDLKYGKHVAVYAEENPQGMLYALGALYEFGDLYGDVEEITIVIVQPRMDSISEWTIPKKELLEWADTEVRPAALATQQADAPFAPGKAQCRWCGAKAACRARAEFNLAVMNEGFVDVSNPGVVIDPQALTPEEIADLLGKVDGIKSWAGGLEAYAQSLLEKDVAVPGYKLVQGKANRKYVDEEAAGKALARKLTKKVAYVEKVISPSVAEGLLGKKDLFFKKHVYKPDGKTTVAVESDKRPALISKLLIGFEIEESEDEKEAA